MSARNLATVLAIGLAAALATAAPPATEGRFRLSVVDAFGGSVVRAIRLPAAGTLEAGVLIGHVYKDGKVFAGADIELFSDSAILRIHIDKEDHGMWPVVATFRGEGEELQQLDLHLVGLTPAQAQQLRVVWGPAMKPRILFGDHQEVEFGEAGFAPNMLELNAWAGWIALDPLVIRATP